MTSFLHHDYISLCSNSYPPPLRSSSPPSIKRKQKKKKGRRNHFLRPVKKQVSCTSWILRSASPWHNLRHGPVKMFLALLYLSHPACAGTALFSFLFSFVLFFFLFILSWISSFVLSVCFQPSIILLNSLSLSHF